MKIGRQPIPRKGYWLSARAPTVVSVLFAFSVSLLPVSCSDTGNSPEHAAATENTLPAPLVATPQFEIVDEKIYDAPIKTEVEQHILVSGEVTEQNLRALLRQQHAEISSRKGFQYHFSPTNIHIYLYDTKEKAEAEKGLWLAMSTMSYSEREATILVKTDQITRLGQEPQEKFGMTEAERQQVYRELVLSDIIDRHNVYLGYATRNPH